MFRFRVAFYTFALVFLAVAFLAIALFCLVDIALTHELPLPFLIPALALAWLLWITWRLLKREMARGNRHDEDTGKSLASVPPPFGCGDQARVRKIPGLNLVCRFIRWSWRIGGLGEVKSPLWLTPFGVWFIVFLSSPLLVSALVMFIRTEVFLHRSIAADGTVIRLVLDQDKAAAPVFVFTVQNGRAITIQSKAYSTPPEFRVGQSVPVLYERDHPEGARIATHWQVYGFEEVSGAIGLFFAVIGLGSLIYQPRRNRRTADSNVAPMI